MDSRQNVFDLVQPLRKEKTVAEASVQALHHAAKRLAGLQRDGSGFKTKDLVGLLLSHGARSWRATLPVATVHVRVSTPEGRPAIRLRGLR